MQISTFRHYNIFAPGSNLTPFSTLPGSELGPDSDTILIECKMRNRCSTKWRSYKVKTVDSCELTNGLIGVGVEYVCSAPIVLDCASRQDVPESRRGKLRRVDTICEPAPNTTWYRFLIKHDGLSLHKFLCFYHLKRQILPNKTK